MDSPGDIQVASSWTSPRTASSTGTVNSSSSPISYYNNLTINLQDTEMDSGVYTVTFSIISFSSYLIGDILNGSRHISVEGKSFLKVHLCSLLLLVFGERAKRARHYQECTNSSWCGMYIYIDRCQVVVQFYRDLYFGYSPPYRSCGD